MCLLVLQKQNASIKEEYLENAFDSNDDGVGYSYVDENRITTKKFRKYKNFLKNWNNDNAKFSNKSPFLLHFRLATHGIEEGTFNVHPFSVRKDMVFAHNGIINEVDDDKKMSDTQVFNRDILQNLKKSFLQDSIMIKLIEGFIGNSKLAFLNQDKSFKIINESAGHWLDDVWFSNNSYQYKSYSYKPNSCGYGNYGGYGWISDDYAVRDKTKAKNSIKHLTLAEACNWCGDKVFKLTHTDITDYYEDDEPSYLWMCDDCIEIEDDELLEQEEIKEWNNSFTDIPLGGKE